MDAVRSAATTPATMLGDQRVGAFLLIASGRAEAGAVRQLVEGPVSAMWPATIVQHHPHVTALVDDAAATRLQLGR